MTATAAVVFIGTSKYKQFFEGYYKGVTSNFLVNTQKTIFVFTDDPGDPVFDKPGVVTTRIAHETWPYITLHRFKYMRLVEKQLEQFDHTFFIDADLWCVGSVSEEDVVGDYKLIGVQHPGFVDKIGSFETDTRSHATIFDGYYDVKKYRQGCLWGGTTPEVLAMIRELDQKIDDDKSRGIVAVWHDESHMNKYFLRNNEKVHTLHPGFAQPQKGYENVRNQFPTKFVHLHKEMSEFPRFEGVR